MLNGLQAASCLIIRASLALFTGVVLLLIQSAFWSTRVSPWMQAVIVAMALVAYFRPHYALLALAAIAPLGQVGSRSLDSQMRGAEALVLAFLAGALLRGWTLGEFRTFPSNRFAIAGVTFGFVVAASCLEQLWLTQIQRDFPWLFAGEVLSYASRNYLTSFRGFGTIFNAMLLLEGVALLLYVARYARQQQQFGERLVMSIVAGAVGTAVLTVWHVGGELFDTGQVQSRLMEFLAVHRWTVHVSDVNAAGSFFVMGMFITLGMAMQKGRSRAAWTAMAAILAATTWMTHSRTAFVAAVLMLASVVAVSTIGRVIGAGKTIAMAVTGSVGLVIALWHYLGPEYFGVGAQSAVRIRWLFLGTTWRMLTSEPLFGVGIGQYFLWSRHFAAPELLEYYQRENAHNNFAQIAGELGLAGLAGFLTVLATSLWQRDKERQSSPIVVPVVLGLAAFILTWLGGHPLLVPEVAYPFWLTLGAAAALAPTWGQVPSSLQQMKNAPGPMSASAIVGLAVVVLLVSIPLRVGAKSARVDLSRVTYGLSARQLMTSRARIFLPDSEPRVELPLRARGASDDEPVEIDVLVDGIASQRVTLSDRSWRRVPIGLSPGSGRRFRQVDLRIRSDPADNVNPARSSVEVGNWEIITKPNG